MMYKTHITVAKGTATSVIACELLTGSLQSNILMNLDKLPELAIKCAVIYTFICWGSEYPDTDLITSKASNRNPINKLIAVYNHSRHLKHRSPQTHSIDICLLQCLGLFVLLKLVLALIKVQFVASTVAIAVIGLLDNYLWLVTMSLFIGNVCHIVADFFTQEGAYILHFLPKFRLVPAHVSFFGYKPFKDFFSTGDDSAWELFVRRICLVYFKATSYVILVLVVLPTEKLVSVIKIFS